jgi:molybdopterin converting factor subunit 1
MRIKIKLFSSLREAVGMNEFFIETRAQTADQLWQELEATFPKLAPFAPSHAIALNHHYAQADQTLNEGDEVAFFPPVSGG